MGLSGDRRPGVVVSTTACHINSTLFSSQQTQFVVPSVQRRVITGLVSAQYNHNNGRIIILAHHSITVQTITIIIKESLSAA